MSTAFKPARLSTEELHQVKQLLGACLAILSFWSLTALEIGGSFVFFVGAILSLFSLVAPGIVARIPSKIWRWVGPIILVFIIADFALNQPEFIPPLVRMVIFLIIYRMLAPRNRREDLQVILLCLFCVVISGALTVSLLFALQILLFAPIAMALLFIVCILDRGDALHVYRIDWENFRWERLLKRVWQVLDFKVIALGSVLFSFVVAVSTLLFILTPRFNLEQAIPFLQLGTKPQSGFSENVELGSVTEIQENFGVALRIDVPSREAVSSTPYWRMLVLDKYEDDGFRLSDSLKDKNGPLRVPKKVREYRSPALPLRERTGALWNFYMEGAMSRYLPVPGSFAAIRFQIEQDFELVPDVKLFAIDAVSQSVFSYQIEDLKFNLRFDASESERELFATLPGVVEGGDSLKYPLTCLELNISQAAREFLQQINRSLAVEPNASAAAYSQAVTDYLWTNFGYSLRIDGGSSEYGDRIVSWLAEGTQGHCELFAGSLVLLAREAGYPARLAIGFSGGSWNTVEDFFVVRNRDAHAWVEIYDATEGNWLRVDPTPGRGSSDPEVLMPSTIPSEEGWSAWVDSLRIIWYRRIVNFEQKDQVEMAMTLKEVFDEYVTDFKAKLQALVLWLKQLLYNPLEGKNFLVYSLMLCLSLAAYLAWRLRYELMSFIFKLLKRPKVLDPVRRQAGRYLKKFRSRGLDVSVCRDLERLRYGTLMTPGQARTIFKIAKKELKRKTLHK